MDRVAGQLPLEPQDIHVALAGELRSVASGYSLLLRRPALPCVLQWELLLVRTLQSGSSRFC